MAGGSKTAVYAAITANSLVTVAKFGGFFMTGSGAMLSEGIHSLADVGNQTLLAVGLTKSKKAPDADHPFGYGREGFIWALISAVGIFFLGCGVTFMHGLQALLDSGHGEQGHHETGSTTLNLGILVFAFVVEGASLLIAMKGMQVEARKEGETLWQYLRTTDDPFGVAVILEDSAAVLGVVLALTAVGLTAATGNPDWDAIGSIAISLLLGLVAIFLIVKNRDLLIGRSIRAQDRIALEKALVDDPLVEDVEDARATVSGADTYRISAELDIDGRYIARKYLETRSINDIHEHATVSPEALQAFLEEFSEESMEIVGAEIDRLEAKIQKTLPKAAHMALEVD